jgi:hypothetical protein
LTIPEQGLSVYPNPTSGIFTITSKSILSALEIYKMTGQLIYSDFKSNQQKSVAIDMTGQANGLYIVKITAGNRINTAKILIR